MSTLHRDERLRQISLVLQQRRLIRAIADPVSRRLLEEEATDPNLKDNERLITVDLLDTLDSLRQEQMAKTAFLRRDTQVFLLPGFMGSWLEDMQGGYGTVWYHPIKSAFGERFTKLKLGRYSKGHLDTDADPTIRLEATGPIGLVYDTLHWALRVADHSVEQIGIDWRKNLEFSASDFKNRLAKAISDNLHAVKKKPIYIIAHSQGSLVARHGLQLLYEDNDYQGVLDDHIKGMILLGPASYGSFSSAFAFAGNHVTLDLLRRIAVDPPDGFAGILQSMSGLYQLLPANEDRLPHLKQAKYDVRREAFWKTTGIDKARLEAFVGWANSIDSSFFADRTRIILGDNKGTPTVAGVQFIAGELQASHHANGDGTVPDPLAYVTGCSHHRAKQTEHLWLPTYRSVLNAIKWALQDANLKVPLPKVSEQNLQAIHALEAPLSLVKLEAKGPKTAADTFPAVVAAQKAQTAKEERHIFWAKQEIPVPAYRLLRVFTFDPLLSTQLDTRDINQVTMKVRWEKDLQPGPIGEYLEVVDYDPTVQQFYEPVDLNHRHILGDNGLDPSEARPQFHQQMVYAVAMTTIDTFERALGRPVLWSPRRVPLENGKLEKRYVPRLRIYPHALRQQNAYYSPSKKALLFGYFQANETQPGKNLPGGMVFTCLSQEIVAHEMTHAILDGIHERFLEASNPDVLAFHEAFADIVALFSHFSYPEVVQNEISKTRSELRQENLLSKLAVQFGMARGGHGALRDAIGQYDPETQKWTPHTPKTTDYAEHEKPHDRGAVLVAAVFDAFLTIYHHRTRDLLRIATNGKGLLPVGELHPDLVRRLSGEASKSAKHVLQMCVRALDYMPPMDFTFGEYLRAIITADFDLVRDDDLGYRVAMIDSFRKRGIYPQGVRTLAEDTLRWQQPQINFQFPPNVQKELQELKCLRPDPYRSREQLFEDMRQDRRKLHELLLRHFDKYDRMLGIHLQKAPANSSFDYSNPYGIGVLPKVEIHAVRSARRVGPDGQVARELIVLINQKRRGYFDLETQAKVNKRPTDSKDPLPPADFWFRGGATLIIDLDRVQIRYAIIKDILSERRLQRQRDYEEKRFNSLSLRSMYFGDPMQSEPFALVHDA